MVIKRKSKRGLSLTELLVSISISAVLITVVMSSLKFSTKMFEDTSEYVFYEDEKYSNTEIINRFIRESTNISIPNNDRVVLTTKASHMTLNGGGTYAYLPVTIKIVSGDLHLYNANNTTSVILAREVSRVEFTLTNNCLMYKVYETYKEGERIKFYGMEYKRAS